MKPFVKKLLLSIFSLLFFFTIFGTVTYAWFSLHKLNQLGNLSIDLITGEEFQVSLDGINFYNEVSTEDIERFIGFKASLTDVTSFDGKRFYYGKLKEDEGLPEANKDYLSFPLFFRTTLKHRHVYLVENVSNDYQYDTVKKGTFVVSKGVLWKADNTFQNGPDPVYDIVHTGDRLMMYAADAIRVAMVEEKIEWNSLDDRNVTDLSRKIFDLSGNEERGYGAPYGGISYFNQKHKIQLSPPEEFPETIYEVSVFDDDYHRYVPLNRDSEILEMVQTELTDEKGNPYYYGKIIVNIWLEGWDADCFNAIYKDSLRIRLEFRAGSPFFQSNQVINLNS